MDKTRPPGEKLIQPAGVEELAAGAVGALVGVSAEIVALGLEEIGGKGCAAVAVVVVKACA